MGHEDEDENEDEFEQLFFTQGGRRGVSTFSFSTLKIFVICQTL